MTRSQAPHANRKASRTVTRIGDEGRAGPPRPHSDNDSDSEDRGASQLQVTRIMKQIVTRTEDEEGAPLAAPRRAMPPLSARTS